ncbi:P-loop containing nucleoside triphosphate hydrolase protein [Amylocarpus encephaloides]|uniref:P-loop containing nucleoside triphosphate hydrolase protein n=1 Tax=Amylocarpus encephaloides TaxID=45428 RepID=A0A9P8C342_9HELO|nr:P-loop containing nucleoside triphosphate hydrolase protein [Amylocarpus encephaloides]
MTDLTAVLPGFPTHQYVRLLPSLEKNKITTADILTLDAIEVAKRAQLPLLDVKRLCGAVLKALQGDLGIAEGEAENEEKSLLRTTGKELVSEWNAISTLDDDLDRALGGGIPTGYITEVTGESGAGKTQFLLTLLLAAQLPAPQGLSCPTLYISTESALPTTRLSQLLRFHSSLANLPHKPTLDAVHCVVVNDLESQDHILRFQVPVQIRNHGIRLIILDSVAANYRAEFERPGAGAGHGANMAQRSTDLVKLGQLLRELAREYNIAVVVANQVADRFSNVGGSAGPGNNSPAFHRNALQSSPLARRSGPLAVPSSSLAAPPDSSIPIPPPQRPFSTTPDPLSLDHQQRWFTGWGDDPSPQSLISKDMKTPSLGLIWTTQIACRISLIKRPVYGRTAVVEDEDRGPSIRKWRRWMKIVFAPHIAASGSGLNGAVEFEVKGEGMRAVKRKEAGEEGYEEDEMLPT